MMLMNMDGSDDEAEEDHAQTEKKTLSLSIIAVLNQVILLIVLHDL